VGSAWTDLDRPPLSLGRLRAALRDDPVWHELRLLDSTESTNAVAATAARDGAAEGLVVVAEQQRSGRGRLDRRWESPPRAGVLLSGLVRPAAPPATWPLVPLLAGVAAVEAIRSVARLPVRLKWPNDVIVDDRKLGGILVERVDDGAVVIGIGINVSTRPDELPVATATSIGIEGGATDREPLVKELLRAMSRRYSAFRAADGAPRSVVPAYREVCETIGRRVVVHVTGREPHRGLATDVDDSGMLVVRADAGRQTTWSAGDVVHVRAEA
jgi:BirA family biotin operon repressor/biotin-[acetyl-CoA-carboxylase] ligase